METIEQYVKSLTFKLTLKTLERRHRHLFAAFIVKFELISQVVMVLPLFTLNR